MTIAAANDGNRNGDSDSKGNKNFKSSFYHKNKNSKIHRGAKAAAGANSKSPNASSTEEKLQKPAQESNALGRPSAVKSDEKEVPVSNSKSSETAGATNQKTPPNPSSTDRDTTDSKGAQLSRLAQQKAKPTLGNNVVANARQSDSKSFSPHKEKKFAKRDAFRTHNRSVRWAHHKHDETHDQEGGVLEHVAASVVESEIRASPSAEPERKSAIVATPSLATTIPDAEETNKTPLSFLKKKKKKNSATRPQSVDQHPVIKETAKVCTEQDERAKPSTPAKTSGDAELHQPPVHKERVSLSSPNIVASPRNAHMKKGHHSGKAKSPLEPDSGSSEKLAETVVNATPTRSADNKEATIKQKSSTKEDDRHLQKVSSPKWEKRRKQKMNKHTKTVEVPDSPNGDEAGKVEIESGKQAMVPDPLLPGDNALTKGCEEVTMVVSEGMKRKEGGMEPLEEHVSITHDGERCGGGGKVEHSAISPITVGSSISPPLEEGAAAVDSGEAFDRQNTNLCSAPKQDIHLGAEQLPQAFEASIAAPSPAPVHHVFTNAAGAEILRCISGNGGNLGSCVSSLSSAVPATDTSAIPNCMEGANVLYSQQQNASQYGSVVMHPFPAELNNRIPPFPYPEVGWMFMPIVADGYYPPNSVAYRYDKAPSPNVDPNVYGQQYYPQDYSVPDSPSVYSNEEMLYATNCNQDYWGVQYTNQMSPPPSGPGFHYHLNVEAPEFNPKQMHLQ